MKKNNPAIQLFVLFVLFGFSSQAQPDNYSQTIEWKQKQEVDKIFRTSPNNRQYFLSFRDAVYNDLSTFLPYFTFRIPVSLPNYEYEIELINTVYETFKPEEISGVKHLENLNPTISIKTHQATHRGKTQLSVSFIPIRKNTFSQKPEKLLSFDIKIKKTGRRKEQIKRSEQDFSYNSVLANGKWVKIGVNKDGIYKITFDELRDMGFDNPENVRVFGNAFGVLSTIAGEPRPDDLIENKIYTGSDYILFYGKNPHHWHYDSFDGVFKHTLHPYSDIAYYFLTDKNTGFNNQISNKTIPSGAIDKTINTFNDYQYFERDSINLLLSGRQWFWKHFDNLLVHSFNFKFPNIIASSPKLTIRLLARSPVSSYFSVSAAGTDEIITINPVSTSSYTSIYANPAIKTFPLNSSLENIPVNIVYSKPAANAEGWLDYIIMNAKRQLIFTDGQMPFRSLESVGTDVISNFALSGATGNLRIWDITEPTHCEEIDGTLSGNTYSFKVETDTLRQFIAFDGTFYHTVITEGEGLGAIENQNLHSLAQHDYIIVSHRDFLPQAEELAGIRRQDDGLSTIVVTPEQIYNEFSSGIPDVSAIRDFAKMIYDRATTRDTLRYLLLFGDGSYDNKSNVQGNSNFILTYQSEESTAPVNSFVTDDFYGLLDNGEGEYVGILDIGVGRLPVKNPEEAQNVLNKIKRYTENEAMGDWRNMLCFIADDADEGQIMHTRDCDIFTQYVNLHYPVFNIEKIYLDAYPQVTISDGQRYPDVNQAIFNRIKKGALIVNYVGHGNEKGLAHEHIIQISDIQGWDNYYKMPVFMTATCEFSRFDDYIQSDKITRTSAGEYVILNPNGGGIALFTTTRLVFSGSNKTLNANFYNYVFEHDENNNKYRLGDIFRLSKAATGSSTSTNKRNFTLIGDPALKLAYPKYNINTTKINETMVNDTVEVADTLKALSKVTISGEITNPDGTKRDDFNGAIYPTVFDKSVEKQTLGNDGADPITFSMQNNILYKGKASVSNGEFSFSFIVPKDIMYKFGKGKISYYANSEEVDSHGFTDKIVIGGTADSIAQDNQGPQIELYLNDKNFVFGGVTNENPMLLAYLSDESGINTVGNGIGHDITAVIDDETSDVVVLNDSYIADKDSYQSGKIEYYFNKLEAGKHTLKLKVWDVYNNSSEAETEFVVVESSELLVDKVLNYPNPFTNKTAFYFEHNQPNTELDVLVQIFTVSGKLIKTIHRKMNTTGYLSAPIGWDGYDDFGDKIGRGVYVYRLRVKSGNGKTVDKFEKLVILK